jgi:hypothetical protein
MSSFNRHSRRNSLPTRFDSNLPDPLLTRKPSSSLRDESDFGLKEPLSLGGGLRKQRWNDVYMTAGDDYDNDEDDLLARKNEKGWLGADRTSGMRSNKVIKHNDYSAERERRLANRLGSAINNRLSHV